MLFSLTALLGLFHSAHSAPYSESITGQNLIGSHFGLKGFNASFDYVVVGAGTAGLTMATRLAESGRYSIAVIEAGDFYEVDNGNLSSIPGDAAYYVGSDPQERNPLIDWEIYTEPQPGLAGRTALYTAGKTLGGDSARNYMLYQRSSVGAYQKWADTVGDQSYTFNNLLPYFQKSVQFTPPNPGVRIQNATPSYNLSAFSPTGGPLQVSYPNWANPLSTWNARGFTELNFTKLTDLESGKILGWAYCPYTIDPTSQTRSSSETSFLRQALVETTNLAVYKSTLAKKILFDASNKATGVVVNSGGVEYTLSANQEIIVSSGVFRSPQLLMVSGIGPQATLAEYGVPVVADRPGVGQNMMDHLLYGADYQVDVTTHAQLSIPAFDIQQVADYNNHRTGLLTNIGADILGFEKLPPSLRSNLSAATQAGLAQLPADWPELELVIFDAFSGYQRDLLTGGPADGNNYGTSDALLVAPFSRGNVTINSTDTSDNPIVSPNFLLDPRDQEVAIAGLKRARQVMHTKSVQSIVVGSERLPGANVTSNADILNWIEQSALTLYHAAATNAMGMANDTNAVVDSQARVIGVTGLRVVDISAFPFLPPGHPQGTVYALAEKIAAQILGGTTAAAKS